MDIRASNLFNVIKQNPEIKMIHLSLCWLFSWWDLRFEIGRHHRYQRFSFIFYYKILWIILYTFDACNGYNVYVKNASTRKKTHTHISTKFELSGIL